MNKEVELNLIFDNIEEEIEWENAYRAKMKNVWYVNLMSLANDKICVLSAVMYK